jgi:hypothetical protein
MNKTFAKAIVALTIGGAALLPSAPASADSAGAAVAAGIGGFALGALAGGAAARPAPYYAPAYAAPVYEPAPVVHCWRERRPLFDEYGEVIGYRPQRVCE